MQEIRGYLGTSQMPKTLNLTQKQKLAKKAEPFTLKEGIVYKVAQDNRMCRYFNYLKSIDCSEGISWSGRRTFCCIYYYKENYGCREGFFECRAKQTLKRLQEYGEGSLETTKGNELKMDIGNVYQINNEIQK